MPVKSLMIPDNVSGARVFIILRFWKNRETVSKIVLTKYHHDRLAKYLRQIGAVKESIKRITQLFGVPVVISGSLRNDRINLHI